MPGELSPTSESLEAPAHWRKNSKSQERAPIARFPASFFAIKPEHQYTEAAMTARTDHTPECLFFAGYGQRGPVFVWTCFRPALVGRVVLFPFCIMKGKADQTKRRQKHFYFEKYEVLDGESRYPLIFVRRTTEPLAYETWMREFIEFSWSTNCEEPWSEQRIRDYFNGGDEALEVYGGERIYRRFRLDEISQEDYEVLWKYLV